MPHACPMRASVLGSSSTHPSSTMPELCSALAAALVTPHLPAYVLAYVHAEQEAAEKVKARAEAEQLRVAELKAKAAVIAEAKAAAKK